MEKLEELLTAVHHHNTTKLLNDRRIFDLIVAATQENRPVIKAHADQMVTIFEAIIREGPVRLFGLEAPKLICPHDEHQTITCGHQFWASGRQ